MNKRMQDFVNRLDVTDDGKVDMEDAQRAFAYVDGEVRPHGWMWTLTTAAVFLLIGVAIGRWVL